MTQSRRSLSQFGSSSQKSPPKSYQLQLLIFWRQAEAISPRLGRPSPERGRDAMLRSLWIDLRANVVLPCFVMQAELEQAVRPSHPASLQRVPSLAPNPRVLLYKNVL